MSVFDMLKKIEIEREKAAGSVSWIIAGLGNPGQKYEQTRHNAGFTALDILAKKCCASVDRLKFKGLCGECVISGQKILLIKPQTFMNLSGECIGEAAAFYKIPPQRILIFSDDISLPTGKLRVRAKGSSGGQNGLKNIIERLGSEEFPRIKIGVGAPPSREYDLAGWVLGKPSDKEWQSVCTAAQKAADAACILVSEGIEAAMREVN